MSVKIVPMTADRLDDVAALERACFSRPWTREMLKEELDNACAAFLVAEEEGRAVGYAGLHVILDEGYIANVAVDAAYRRRGIAKQLMQVYIDFARANRLAFLTLEVRPSNTAAILLYGQLGFRSSGRRKNYYEHPKEDCIIMTRTFGEESLAAEGTLPC